MPFACVVFVVGCGNMQPLGDSFFQNVETGDRSWLPPDPPKGSRWSRHRDTASKRTFYHNAASNEDRWTYYIGDALVAGDRLASSQSHVRTSC